MQSFDSCDLFDAQNYRSEIDKTFSALKRTGSQLIPSKLRYSMKLMIEILK